MTQFELDFRPLDCSDGAAQAAFVPWDSEAIGASVWELRLSDSTARTTVAIHDWLLGLDRSADCLVGAKVDQEHVSFLAALAHNGFYPVETTLRIEGDLARVSSIDTAPPIPLRLRTATQADMGAVSRIAGSAFWADRFHLDPNVPNSAADMRYVTWVGRAFDDGEQLFVYERTDVGQVVGFYLVRPVTDSLVDLTLVAIDPTLAGLRIGSALYRTVMRECARMGFSRARTTIVARNLPALNIYSRLGFSFNEVLTSMHWFAPATERNR